MGAGIRTGTHRSRVPIYLLSLAVMGLLVLSFMITGSAVATPSAVHPPLPPPGCSTPGCSISLNVSSESHLAIVKVTGKGYYPLLFATVYFWNGVSGGLAQKVGPGHSINSHGSFQTTFSVPKDPVGAYTVFVTDQMSDNASAPFQLTHLGVSPNSGPVSNNAVVTGSGFLPHATVTLKMGGANVGTVGGCSTSAHGVIVQGGYCILYVPNLSPGTYKLTATDGTRSAQVNFTVT
jgi:hypothetical protein